MPDLCQPFSGHDVSQWEMFVNWISPFTKKTCHCLLSKKDGNNTDVFIFRPIQFYLNNATNLPRLTSQSMPCCPTTQRSYCDHRLQWCHFTLCLCIQHRQQTTPQPRRHCFAYMWIFMTRWTQAVGTLCREQCKNGWTNWDAGWNAEWGGPMEHDILHGDVDASTGRGTFGVYSRLKSILKHRFLTVG